MLLHFRDNYPHGFLLAAPDKEFEDAGDLPWNTDIEAEFYEVGAVLNRKGEISAFNVEFVSDGAILNDILAYVKQKPPPGLYTVPELGLKDVPFDVVLEKIKEYYKKSIIEP